MWPVFQGSPPPPPVSRKKPKKSEKKRFFSGGSVFSKKVSFFGNFEFSRFSENSRFFPKKKSVCHKTFQKFLNPQKKLSKKFRVMSARESIDIMSSRDRRRLTKQVLNFFEVVDMWTCSCVGGVRGRMITLKLLKSYYRTQHDFLNLNFFLHKMFKKLNFSVISCQHPSTWVLTLV